MQQNSLGEVRTANWCEFDRFRNMAPACRNHLGESSAVAPGRDLKQSNDSTLEDAPTSRFFQRLDLSRMSCRSIFKAGKALFHAFVLP